MHRKSLKLKITLWYATFMLLLTAIFVGLIEVTTSLKTDDNVRESLIRTVELVASNITEQKTIDFEDLLQNEIDSYLIGIYGSNGDLMAGTRPEVAEMQLGFSDGQLQSLIINYHVYYVYDKKISTGADYVWVRGYVRSMTAADTVYNIGRVTLISLPVFVLLMLAGGYILTSRALRPLHCMIEEADSISGGDDLNRRIEVADTQDEIFRLGNTINQMLERLQRSFQREKQFTSDVSHELRTPLSVILAQCELLEEDAGFPKEYRQDFGVIQRQSERMRQMAEELLQLSRLEPGYADKHFVLVNISELVTELAEEQKLLYADNDTCITDIEAGITVNGNEKLLIRAFTNILNNAHQYGKGWISISLKAVNGSMVFSAEDHGQGIREENLDKIWDRFYQEESSRTYGGGFGLGLPMVKSIVALHNGNVSVQSGCDKGSIFTIEIPMTNEVF